MIHKCLVTFIIHSFTFLPSELLCIITSADVQRLRKGARHPLPLHTILLLSVWDQSGLQQQGPVPDLW